MSIKITLNINLLSSFDLINSSGEGFVFRNLYKRLKAILSSSDSKWNSTISEYGNTSQSFIKKYWNLGLINNVIGNCSKWSIDNIKSKLLTINSSASLLVSISGRPSSYIKNL